MVLEEELMKRWICLTSVFLLACLTVSTINAALNYSVSISAFGQIEYNDIDSLSFASYGSTVVLADVYPNTSWSADAAEAQSFMGKNKKISTAEFYLRKGSVSNPTGDLYVALFSHTGDYGVDGRPGTELARSDPVDMTTLPSQVSGYRAVSFEFSGSNRVTLSADTPYFICLLGSDDVSTTNKIEVAASSTSSHAGNYARYRSGWSADSSKDLIFSVSGTLPTTADIDGTVFESDGSTVIKGATVELIGYYATTTDLNGFFQFYDVLGRNYQLRVSKIGYETVTHTVDTTANGYFPMGPIILQNAASVGVYGTVTNPSGGAVIGGTVTLFGSTTYSTTTDSSGLYNFGSVPQGNYIFQITGTNYQPVKQSIAITQETQKNVQLSTTGGSIPIPVIDGQMYHMAFASWGQTAAPLPDAGRQDLNRFTNLVGKTAYAAENAGTVCVGEDFWVMREPNSWEPLLDEGLFDVFIFSLNPYLRSSPSDSDTNNGPTATELKIAAGQYDSWLGTIAQQCKDFAYPIMLKIGVEMNGNQGSGTWGASWVADYGADADAFIACWRYIVDYFKAAGVTNVEWCISYTFESIGPYDFNDYYPGEDYIDWIGIDVYQISSPDDPAMQLTAFYNWAKDLGKPLGVTEWGVNWYNKALPDADRARYINDFFDVIESQPEYKFIRYHWNYWWRFQDDDPSDPVTYMPQTTAAYRTRIANSRYLGTGAD